MPQRSETSVSLCYDVLSCILKSCSNYGKHFTRRIQHNFFITVVFCTAIKSYQYLTWSEKAYSYSLSEQVQKIKRSSTPKWNFPPSNINPASVITFSNLFWLGAKWYIFHYFRMVLPSNVLVSKSVLYLLLRYIPCFFST